MADEAFELGLEGLNKFAEKYHDNVYDHVRVPGRQRHHDEPSNKRTETAARSSPRDSFTNQWQESHGDRMIQPRGPSNQSYQYGSLAGQNKDERMPIEADYHPNRYSENMGADPRRYRRYSQGDDQAEYRYREHEGQSSRRTTRSVQPSRHQRESKSRARARSQTRLASGLVGALAGALAGSRLSEGDTLSAVAGAVIGAVSANQIEKRIQKRKPSL